MEKIKLNLFDRKHEFKETINFFKQVYNSSINGLIKSILFILLLIALDYSARNITQIMCDSEINIFNNTADYVYKLNNIVGLKFLDYFKDVIVIVAGILGVILGLFFTSFLNIITSKYSNINSEIINQLIEQKIINKYFKLLSILVSSSIIFQLVLALGYNPTFISSFLFTLIVLLALLSFVFFGRFSLIYFNAGNLVFDLLNSNYQTLHRAFKNKFFFNRKKNGFEILYKLRDNIKKIKIIVDESAKPQFTNTDLESISNQLLNFSIYYNQIKHTLPSNKGWHPKTQRYKKWDEASSSDYQFTSSTRAFLLPETFDDYIYLEKQIIETQFFIFKNIQKTNEKVIAINNQFRYLQTISFQCEEDLFETFFNELESIVKNNLQENSNEENLQLISIYSNLLIQYLVGFNYNFERIITFDNLKSLAKAIHFFQNTNSVLNIPYGIRIWIDSYQAKLINEKYNEEKILTTLFYTEFELARQVQNLFKIHINKISNDIFKRIILFSSHLKESNNKIESLEFLIQTLDVYNKVILFSEIIEKKIKKEINLLNLKKEKDFSFDERIELVENCEKFKNAVLKEIWNLGHFGHSVKSKNLPDIYGNFYQLICDDIIDKAFKNNGTDLIEYLPKFLTYNLLYLESLKAKIETKRFEYTSSKMFPIIVDLLDVSSITILLFKAHKNKDLENIFYEFWNDAFENNESKEKFFWDYINSIYQYFNQPILSLSTPSYVREQKRKALLENYIKNSEFVRIEEEKGHFSFNRHYVSNIDDIYLNHVVSGISVDRYNSLRSDDLSDLFIEYFLKTRLSLKEIKFKQTVYGTNLKRYLERNS